MSWNDSLRVMWVHRLVQETSHIRMGPEESQKAFQQACNILYAAWPQQEWHNRRQHKLWEDQETIIHHIVSLGNFYQSRVLDGQSDSAEAAAIEPELQATQRFAELLYLGAWYYIERGFLRSAETLLDLAKKICETRVQDSELVLADIYGGYGAIDSERNKLQETLQDFQLQYDYLMKALEKNLWRRPHVREALALGGLGQGYAGLNNLPRAEEYYYRCIEAWEEAPGEPTIYQSHLGTCLCFQGRLEEAEAVLTKVIQERAEEFGPCDTTSYR